MTNKASPKHPCGLFSESLLNSIRNYSQNKRRICFNLYNQTLMADVLTVGVQIFELTAIHQAVMEDVLTAIHQKLMEDVLS